MSSCGKSLLAAAAGSSGGLKAARLTALPLPVALSRRKAARCAEAICLWLMFDPQLFAYCYELRGQKKAPVEIPPESSLSVHAYGGETRCPSPEGHRIAQALLWGRLSPTDQVAPQWSVEGITESPQMQGHSEGASRGNQKGKQGYPFLPTGSTASFLLSTSVVPRLANWIGRKTVAAKMRAAENCSTLCNREGRYSHLSVCLPMHLPSVIYRPLSDSNSLPSISLCLSSLCSYLYLSIYLSCSIYLNLSIFHWLVLNIYRLTESLPRMFKARWGKQ